MSVDEVEAILGPHAHKEGEKLVWHGEREGSGIVIGFDANGRVRQRTFAEMDEPPSIIRKLLNIIPWLREEPDPNEMKVL